MTLDLETRKYALMLKNVAVAKVDITEGSPNGWRKKLAVMYYSQKENENNSLELKDSFQEMVDDEIIIKGLINRTNYKNDIDVLEIIKIL